MGETLEREQGSCSEYGDRVDLPNGGSIAEAPEPCLGHALVGFRRATGRLIMMLVSSLAIAITVLSVFVASTLLKKLTTAEPYHWLVALLTSAVFGGGAFVLSFFIINTIAGLGSGGFPVEVAARISSLNMFLGMWIAWSNLRSGSQINKCSEKNDSYAERIEPRIGSLPATEASRFNDGAQSSLDRYEELMKLKSLLDAGVLNDEEFKREKELILRKRHER